MKYGILTDADWRCTDPDCFLGAHYRKTGPRTAIGIGWCVACKGGTAPAPGMGRIRNPLPSIPVRNPVNPVQKKGAPVR